MHDGKHLAGVLLLGLVVLLAGGCASWDRHVFQSTEQRPTRVTLVDVEAGEMLWRFDVPPNHRLTVDLAHGGEIDAGRVRGQSATYMQWKLHRVGPEAMVELDGDLTRRVNGGRIELEDRLVRLDVDYAAPMRRERAAEPVEAGIFEGNDADPPAE